MAKAKEAKADKTNAMRLLDSSAVSYASYSYSTEDGKLDGVSVAEKVGFAVEQVFKTLVTIGASGAFHVFVVPVATELDLKKAARAAAEKNIAMAPAKDLLKHTGYIHGGCSPLGMKKPFPTYLHESAKEQETMVVSAGRIGLQIELAPADLARLCNAQFYDLTK